ncbi:MAG: aminotransferase class I/II-fold pyridoxal phosphate-dependent enzyme, partial [Bosea sp.]|uniref:aminotransferase class I/II-fold pyridoxal phosphate-dependent enzyme n=1 Tax=Bosea sp. (in: a-proteobacteria) TaxID=1871050 RepID=UPI00238A1E6C|nr:aminotransferase class I/II-fold pyridoxal phosphate-dependent enzyme [Bosea sp. (in: a-proteobacteria)]
PLARPALRDRCLVVSSIGKTFSLTGWKVGWVVGAPGLSEAVRAAHQFTIFSVATPLQVGAATALRLPDSYFEGVQRDHLERRDLLVHGLREAGLHPIEPEGTYFGLADIARSAAVSLVFRASLAEQGIRLRLQEASYELPAQPESESSAVRWLC